MTQLARDGKPESERRPAADRFLVSQRCLSDNSPNARFVLYAAAQAVRAASAGEPFLSPTVTRRLMQHVASSAATYERARATLAALTPRERDVVIAIAQGRSNADIAGELAMSLTTVKAHVSNILTKLDLTNRTQIAVLVHDAGLI